MHVIGYIQPNEKWVKAAPVYFDKGEFYVYKGRDEFLCPVELLKRMELIELGDGKVRAMLKMKFMEAEKAASEKEEN